MSLVSIMAASSTMTTVRPFHAVRPLLRANSSLWTVAARAKPSRAHVLGDGVGRRQADDPVAARLIGLADRRHGVALAGAGLAVDERQALGAGRVVEGARLLAR